LYIAVLYNKPLIAEILLKNGANPNILQPDYFEKENFKMQSCLHFSVKSGNLITTKLLLKYHAKTNILDSSGFTPLHYAKFTKFAQDFKKLFEKSKVTTKIQLNFKIGLQKSRNNRNFNSERPVSVQETRFNTESNDFIGQSTEPTEFLTKTKENLKSCVYNKLDAYEFCSLLGKGSFGEVYLVKHKSTNRYFALKIMQKAKIISRDLLKYILSEKNVMITNRHPFIVNLYCAFQTRFYLFLVMDYCPGGDLSKMLLQEKHFPEGKAKIFICEIILALEDLHKRGIIFR